MHACDCLFIAWSIDIHSHRLAEQVVLELGSGVGLVGVVASGHVKKIFCTGKSLM